MNIQDKPFLPIGGLCLDTEAVNQPDGTTRFALNVIHDSSEGSQGSINNEHSNQLCVDLDGDILGIINADRTTIFTFTSNNSIYRIDTNSCTKELIINNPLFNFTDTITGTFRVIKGCEDVIYWRDSVNPDRQLNLSKLDDYTDINTFNISPEYKYPENVELTVQEGGGRLEYGTYYFVLQYLDDSGNIISKSIPYGPVNVSGGLNIDNVLPDIGGKPLANKSIKIDITNVDNRFTAIKVGVIKYTTSDGVTPSAQEVGDLIELNSNVTNYTFYYRGFNPSNGDTNTIQSLLTVPNVFYEQSKVLKQVQNRLVRANLIEKAVDYSIFQKYASKIASQWVTQDVNIDDMFNNYLRTEIGDEVKAYGIVYVFRTGQLSPVFHIPGDYVVDTNSLYLNPNNYCNKDNDYWGVDKNGVKLLNTSVRQHKVPDRSTIPILSNTNIRHIGIKFTNVEYPPNQDIVSHYFVTNERNNNTRTVLQTGVVTPFTDVGRKDEELEGKYIAFDQDNTTLKATNLQNFISADYLYLNDVVTKGSDIKFYGSYESVYLHYSWDQDRQKDNPTGAGSFSELLQGETEYKHVNYWGELHYTNNYYPKAVYTANISESYSLQAQEQYKNLVNNSKSSKFNILTLDKVIDQSTGYFVPTQANSANQKNQYLHYVAIKSNVPILTNLNSITYRLMDNRLYNENSVATIYSGDAFISPLNITNIKRTQTVTKALETNRFNIYYELLQNVFTESIINTNNRVEGSVICNRFYDVESEYIQLSNFLDIVQPNGVRIKYWNNIVYSNYLAKKQLRNNYLIEHIFTRIVTTKDLTLRKFVIKDSNDICDEWYGYNLDWTILTSSRLFRSLGYYYDYCSNCSNQFPNRVIWSEVSREEDIADNYKAYKALSYYDIPADKGSITSFDYIDNVILLRTTQSSYILQPNPQQLQATGTTIAIGTGDFLSIPAQELVSVSTGYGGQQDVLAEVNTKFGLVWVDREEGKVFLKPSGGGFEEISTYKMYHWFENNLRNGKTICTYDPRFERLILHNKYIDNQVNKGFTLSYNLRTKTWVSFHSYQPDLMTFTNNTFFSTLGKKLYAHNKYDTFTTYYDTSYPCIIEAVDTNFNTFNAHSVYIYAQVQKYDNINSQWIPVNNLTFDEAVFYNKLQSSGLIKLVVKDELQSLIWSNVEKPVSIKDKNTRISQIRDIAVSNPVMTNDWQYLQTYYNDNQGYIDKVPLPTSIDYNKPQYQLNEFSDKYIQLRFIFNNNSHKITIHLMDINKFASLR